MYRTEILSHSKIVTNDSTYCWGPPKTFVLWQTPFQTSSSSWVDPSLLRLTVNKRRALNACCSTSTNWIPSVDMGKNADLVVLAYFLPGIGMSSFVTRQRSTTTIRRVYVCPQNDCINVIFITFRLIYLPRDAMYSAALLWRGVCLSRSCIVSKRLKYPQKTSSPSGSGPLF